jgi:putative selenium metabolism hydrolase
MHQEFSSRLDVPALVTFTQELIKRPSVLGNEAKVAGLVAEQLRVLGFDAVETDRAGNVIGVLSGDLPGPTILLDAHMDTVDAFPAEAWTRDPFGGERVNDRIYGRGSSDMKGALAAMVFGVAGVERSRIKGRVVVSASVGEESTEGPALKLVMDAFPPDFVVIGESTELNVARGGRGRAEFDIEVVGKSCHASSPQLGSNAILEMVKLVAEIERLVLPEHAFLGKGVSCLTGIRSDPDPPQSMVPGACRVTYERRLLPDESLEQICDELKECCSRAGVPETRIDLAVSKYKTYTGFCFEGLKWYAAWEISERHELVHRTVAGLRAVGLKPELTSYQFCTNAAHSAGELGVPTIGFGPSSEALAHTVDEYVAVEQVEKAARGYQAICSSVLGDSG